MLGAVPDPAPREFSFSYNGVVVGGVSTNLLYHRRYRHTRDRDTAQVVFEFVVVETVEAAFRQTCAAVESAFDTPYKALTVRLGGQVLVHYPAQPKAECIATIEKLGDDDGPDTARSRLYRVTVDVNRAATWSPVTNGLRELEVDVSASETERKTLKISGTFTSVNTAGARARYDAAIAGLVSSVQTDIGGTWEQVGEGRSAHDLNDFTLEFEREYREVKFSQGGASVDDAALVDQVLTLTRSDENPGDSAKNPTAGTGGAGGGSSSSAPPKTGNVRRLTRITAEYEAGVPFSQSTDLKGKIDSIRSWIISQIKDTFNASGGFAVVSEDIGPIAPDSNHIKARIVALVAADGQTIWERRVTLSDDDDANETFHKLFTGDRFKRLVYGSMGDLVRTLTISEKRIGTYSLAQARANVRSLAQSMSSTEGVPGAGGGKWSVGHNIPSVTPIRIGIGGEVIEGVEVESSISRIYFEEQKGSGKTKTPGKKAAKTKGEHQPDAPSRVQGLVRS